MKKEEVASISIIKILLISIVLVIISGIAVIAINVNLNEVKIVFPNGYEISTVTSKVKVSEILETNNIVLKEDEKTIPDVNSEISSGDVINIIKKTEQEVFISKMSKNGTSTSTEDLLDGYTEITEKIIKEQKTIPFETVTKEVGEGDEVKDEVLQEGEDGIKEYTYKVKYQKDVEVEKTLLSEEIIKEPVEKIVQIKKTKVTSRSIEVPRAGEVGGTVGEYQEYAKERCAEYGWSDTDFDCLVALWNKESHWNVTAQNRSSGAYGIPQALPASKMAAYGSDYLENYKTQIDWGLNYIANRYGTPTAAYEHSSNVNWY